MEGRTTTGLERLRAALEEAHEKLQAARVALDCVQLAAERAENDALAAAGPRSSLVGEDAVGLEFARMRTDISELRPLAVPIVRWLQKARREVGTHGS